MENQFFVNKTLPGFLKSEFKSRKNSIGILGSIGSFFGFFIMDYINFKIQKRWSKHYKVIEESIVTFYPELKCEISGGRPSFLKLLENFDKERISFGFNRTHLAITSDTFFFFPYTDSSLSFNSYEKSFRLVFGSDNAPKIFQENKNLKFISIENVQENTKLTLKVAELQNKIELVFNERIELPISK
ncbi:hypothetical protein [Dokdonia sp. R86516]|uniref:hypothetical protein n=1 Tax=Dokdonia sp. R86516 TaxID=3093856 RepID=UPI0037C7734C